MRKKSKVGLLMGLFFTAIGIVMFAFDAGYILLGRTVDLNKVLAEGGELPRDKVVTYTCEVPIGNYAEMQTYLNGIIPLPAKSQLYAMYDKYGGDGIIFSAKLRSKYKMAEFDSAVNNDTPKITLEGRLMTIDNDAFGCLEQVCGDLSEENITLTYYVIDTTSSRIEWALMYLFITALGVFCLVTYFKKKV